jgi:hypothetical protein
MIKSIENIFQDNKEAKAQWNDVYDKLRAEFKFASDACFQKNLISEVDRHKYYMSGNFSFVGYFIMCFDCKNSFKGNSFLENI